MQQILNRLFILLKSNIKSYSFCFLSILIIISSALTYKYENTNHVEIAGIVFKEDNKYNQKLKNAFETSSDFAVYTTKEQMYSDILKNNIICGFVIDKNIEDYYISDFKDYKVDFVTLANNNRAQAYKEVFFDIFIRIYNDNIIAEIVPDLFENNDDHLTENVIENKNRYLAEDDLFKINIININSSNELNVQNTNYTKGLLAIFTFMSVVLGAIRLYDEDKISVTNCMSIKRRIGFKVLYLSSHIIPIAIICYVLDIIYNLHNNITVLTLKMLLLCIYSIIWAYIFQTIISSRKTYYNFIIISMPLMLLLCPVIINLGIYIPAVDILKYIYPISLYM